MLKKIVVFLFAASVCAFAYSQKVNIIPAPASVTELNEEGFSLNQKTVLYIDTKGEEMEVAKFLQESFSSAFGTKLRTIDKKKLKNKDLKNAIIFVRVSDKTLKDEGYQLDINKDKIVGMVFNPNDEKMVIVLKDVLLPIMPGEKPKPEFYRE